MNRAKPRLLWISLGLALIAAAGLTAYWFIGAGLVRQNIEAWAAEWRAGGNTLSYRTLEITGFPLVFRARFEAPLIGRAGGKAPWQWQAPDIKASLAPWRRGRVDGIELAGTHRIRFTARGAPVTLVATAAHALGRVEMGREVNTGTLELGGVDLAPEGAEESVRIEQATIHGFLGLAPNPDHLSPTIAAIARLQGVVLPAHAPGPLGARVERLRLEASVMGPLSPELSREAFAAWRDDGGTVELEAFFLRWGPLTLSANGTLALDEKMQPMGALTATIAGFAETLDALAAAGAVKARDANSAKILFALLARPPKPGAPPELSLPLTIRKRKLFVGPVALFKLPPIRWQ